MIVMLNNHINLKHFHFENVQVGLHLGRKTKVDNSNFGTALTYTHTHTSEEHQKYELLVVTTKSTQSEVQ